MGAASTKGDPMPQHRPDGGHPTAHDPPANCPVAELTDEELLARAGTDATAFAEFYRRHVAAVERVGARRLRTAEEVADLVATVFLKVLETAQTFESSRGTARGWLHVLAVTAATDEQRRRFRRQRAHQRLQGRRFLEPDDISRLEERIDAQAEARAALAAIGRLPAGERRIVELVAVDGLAVTEAAQALGISPDSARQRLARARRKLRPQLNALPEKSLPLAATNLTPEAAL